MAQLIFKWATTASYADEDFILSESNAHACGFLQEWPKETDSAALLVGPASSGKTHLAQGWAARTGACIIDLAMLGQASSAELWKGARCAVLENIEAVTDETAFFHLLRHSETHHQVLLITARMDAKTLAFTLPDLRSRLLSLQTVHILPPDDMLLQGFILKYFADHQLRVGEDVIRYLTRRVERSLERARSLAEKIECASIEAKREITVPFVRALIE